MSSKLSFIVPVYNVVPYLRKCVFSLVHQDFKNYEVILVDDGSIDDSGKICDELSETISDERLAIRVIHQKNEGLGVARNAGLKEAKGEYVCFVDSDDYWEENVLGGLMAQIEQDNLDVLRFNYQNVRIVNSEELIVNSKEEGVKYEVFSPNKDPKRDVDYSDVVTDGETFLNERLGPACYAVMFVIRRNLIIGDRKSEIGDCLFTEGIYFEDTDWTPRMLLKAKRVASTSRVVYNYLWRTGSITLPTDPKKREKVIRDKIALLYGFNEQSRLVKNPKWFTWMTSFNTMSILGMLAMLPSDERKTYIDELKLLNIFPLSTKKEKVLSHKIKIILTNLSPSLYCKLMHLLH